MDTITDNEENDEEKNVSIHEILLHKLIAYEGVCMRMLDEYILYFNWPAVEVKEVEHQCPTPAIPTEVHSVEAWRKQTQKMFFLTKTHRLTIFW